MFLLQFNVCCFLLTVCFLEMYPGRSSSAAINTHSLFTSYNDIVHACLLRSTFNFLESFSRLNEEFVNEFGSRHVAEVLRRNKRLRELWLCLIHPEDKGFRMLCEGLQHPDCVVETLWWVISISFLVWCVLLSLEIWKCIHGKDSYNCDI